MNESTHGDYVWIKASLERFLAEVWALQSLGSGVDAVIDKHARAMAVTTTLNSGIDRNIGRLAERNDREQVRHYGMDNK